MTDFDICVIGSGAGGGPVALRLAQAGYEVIVLEKGPWFTEQDYYKDELACCRRDVYIPDKQQQPHVVEDYDGVDAQGQYKWASESTADSGWNFWNGNVVGGATNFMSGFFYRLKPIDFRLRSEFGPIDGANVVDWPISYEDLEPYYTLVETEVGVSGEVSNHPHAEPRSTPRFPYPPTAEHPVCDIFDRACRELKLNPLRTPRAVLPHAVGERRACEYSGYCGSYGCATGAKGSARAALLGRAQQTGRCRILPHAQVQRLITDKRGNAVAAEYIDAQDRIQQVRACIFVVACQAIESARLLLLSTGPRHPQGLGNHSGQLGRNLVFSAGGAGSGEFRYRQLDPQLASALKARGPFVNRGLQDWYVIDDEAFGRRAKGGTIDFLLSHPNPIGRANALKWEDGHLIWGTRLKRRLKAHFTEAQYFKFEVFNDWLPNDDCFVELDGRVKDRWGRPAAKIRIGYHDHDVKVGRYLVDRAKTVLEQMGAVNISGGASGSPPPNLVAGGCRFGADPKQAVLDPDCRVHHVDNVFVTDGSWMPTGGSVPYTWTIYANAFRVADIIATQLG